MNGGLERKSKLVGGDEIYILNMNLVKKHATRARGVTMKVTTGYRDWSVV